MPTGIYIRTEKTKKILSDSHSGSKNSFYGKKHTEESKQKISKSNTGKKHPMTEETKLKLSISHKGKIFTEEHKNNIALGAIGNKNSVGKIVSDETKLKIKQKKLLNGTNKHRDETKLKISISSKGKKHTEESKQKMREAKIENIMKDGQWPSVGDNEKQLLDEQEIKNGCKIDRKFKILGYKPDGYCHETNTIYEVYEKFHDKHIQEDLERENKICNKLGCDFIIIFDRTH
jgi:hypothetical protein